MANLDQLFPDFLSMEVVTQAAFFHSYHERRKEDLLSAVRFIKKPSRKTKTDKLQATLSKEEMEMMKKLGLKAKDILTLMAAVEEEEDETEDEDEIESED